MQETESSRAEIQRKLTRMVRFIELEGDEKAQEINDRTEEEYHIIKGNLIQEGRIKINQEYDKELAFIKNQSQVQLGVITSKYRHELLQSKRQTLTEVYEQIYSKITSDLSCVNRRWSVLQLLIMEALFRLLDDDVILKCREADVAIITKHLSDLEAKYELHTNSKIHITIDTNYIVNDSLPGIIVTTKNGRVQVNNTLVDRIEQIVECVTPILSSIFYGTKKFSTNK